MAEIALKKITELDPLNIADLENDDLLVVYNEGSPKQMMVEDYKAYILANVFPKVVGILGVNDNPSPYGIVHKSGLFVNATISVQGTGVHQVKLNGGSIYRGYHQLVCTGESGYCATDLDKMPWDTATDILTVTCAKGASTRSMPFTIVALQIVRIP